MGFPFSNSPVRKSGREFDYLLINSIYKKTEIIDSHLEKIYFETNFLTSFCKTLFGAFPSS